MLNDDTPHGVCNPILTLIFPNIQKKLQKIMLSPFMKKVPPVGIYTYEIAEQKALEATTLSRDNGFSCITTTFGARMSNSKELTGSTPQRC